ncbi:hypothetical protein A8924_2779 [Saccharopolyspora erythraea NRRL 2338]|uniref:Uncharacterized protein n=2 Tax=Saccharopolyspora erythraea TaxID=1836 RepID=A4FCA9_SACEN|nr:VWA domain-containing protein [Saccharopolyspora erythraea]EQD84992.1 hypothetical protein N599_17245 [Saccharopolyspora erythraea D]PFG95445.1 hypothetical protein A8924_2779 [Saccharopolyspora erythraea NRRL 2338]QRK92079.1 VWA domain-containing protein [Saccharopolyspora erythraea]CAM01684.1 hypothetical protein SACE_2384 [Saccharopolyspora erythraea NRRL 2338]
MTAPTLVAVAFSQLLRRCGVGVSPAETIEAREVLDLVGPHNLTALRASLRAVTTKYRHESAAFDAAFDRFFLGTGSAGTEDARPDPSGQADLPATELDLVDDEPLAGYTDHNPRAEEIGDLLDAPPDPGDGFNPHKDDDDLSLSTSERELSVRTGGDNGRRGISYTVEVSRAGSAVARELASGRAAPPSARTLDWTDARSLLAWLDALDPHAVYRDGPEDPRQPTDEELARLAEAVEAFVASLAEQVVAPAEETPQQEADAVQHAELQRACHEFLRRVRGAARQRPLRRGRGKLDIRRTVRRSMRADGIPFEPIVRRPLPDRVRLLVVADVSLSVRPVTAFALRLAQTMHGAAHRCRVLCFVDKPIEVTDELRRRAGDDVLSRILAGGRIDLEADSDYGAVLTGILARHSDAFDRRTVVLFVGDGRCNGRAPGVEELAELRRRVHRIGWITPEPRRYWRQASCAMEDFAEQCDAVVVARDPAELVRGVDDLVAGLS